MATKHPRQTEGVTVRMEVEIKRVFVELAAEESIALGASRTAQDVMRNWLEQHPAVKARLEQNKTKV